MRPNRRLVRAILATALVAVTALIGLPARAEAAPTRTPVSVPRPKAPNRAPMAVPAKPGVDTCTPLLEGRTAGLVPPGSTKALCSRVVTKPATSSPLALQSTPTDVLAYCATHTGQWYIWRDQACASGLLYQVNMINLTTGLITGTAVFEVRHYTWTQPSGSVNWAENITVSRVSYLGEGNLLAYDVNMVCDGACMLESNDTMGPTPGAVTTSGTWYFRSTIATAETYNYGQPHFEMPVTAPGYSVTVPNDYMPRTRCDNILTLFSTIGCVFPDYAPTASWSYSEPLFWEVSQHIYDAQASGLPGRPGTSPLHRLYNSGLQTQNRNKACPSSFPTGAGQSCDEYPFASTYEGAVTGGGAYSARAVNADHNSKHGTALGDFYREQRIFDYDAFWVDITDPPGTTGTTIMAVGDSITQGLEGDYTWRYRLKQHLGTGVNFVGPYTGTTKMPTALPDGYPDVSPEPIFTGAYRDGMTFDSDHFAQWGRQAHQAKDDVYSRVRQYRPNYLLVELGFNDLGWGVSDAAGLTADIKTIIANARSAKPDIRILVANVVHRTPLPQLPNLDALISSYNSGLAAALSSVNTATSPVRLVDISTGYGPTADAYDGLHPNGVGEYKIARSFANVLSGQFGLGGTFGSIPSSVPKLLPTKPGSIYATPTDAGITVSWAHVFGAGGYWFWSRDVTAGQSFQRLPLPIPADSWKNAWVQTGHTYEYKVVPMRGNDDGPESDVASVVANPKTAAGPPNVTTIPGNGYIDVSWGPATGAYSDSISGYKVSYNDMSVAGSILQSKTVTGLTTRLSGLINGHQYAIVVASVNAYGEGFPSGAPSAIPWTSGPATPTLSSAKIVDAWDVKLTWTEVPAVTGYVILSRNAVAGAAFTPLPFTVTGNTYTVGWLFDGSEKFEFCLVAVNGSLSSARSNCLRSQT